MSEGIEFRHRTHDEARAALRDFCDAAWGNKIRKDGSHINIFTIPKDEDRDADCILYDVLRERDLLLEALKAVQYWSSDANMPCCYPRETVTKALEKYEQRTGERSKK